MGIVRSIQKGEAPAGKFSKAAQKAAKSMKKSSVRKYAKTKHDDLPKKVKEERDYKDEYKKFQSSKKAKKYRAELNKYNRQKGTYGNGDGKDASHKRGKIVGFEAQSKNRGRAEKSRLKKEAKGEDTANLQQRNLANSYIAKFDKDIKGVIKYLGNAGNRKKAMDLMKIYKKHWVEFVIQWQKRQKLNEAGMEMNKLKDAIKMFQKKIEKQGRVTNARDEEHLKNLIKLYVQMGGKGIKELVEVMCEITYGQMLAKKGKKVKVVMINGRPVVKIVNIHDEPEAVKESDMSFAKKMKQRGYIKKGQNSKERVKQITKYLEKYANKDFKGAYPDPYVSRLQIPGHGPAQDWWMDTMNSVDRLLGENINESKEPEVIKQLRDIVKRKQNKVVKDPKSGKKMRVDGYSASAIVQVYDALNTSNKKKFSDAGLMKMQSIAFKFVR